MKTKFILTLLLIISFYSSLFCQDLKTVYSCDANILSALTLGRADSTNFEVATTDQGAVFIKNLGSNSDARCFNLDTIIMGTKLVYLSGGFFDSDNNIVTYGFDGLYERGVVLKIHLNSEADSVVVLISDEPVIFTDGCEGTYSPDNNEEVDCYAFVGDNHLHIVNRVLGVRKRISTGSYFPNSISYDSQLSKFVISGVYHADSLSDYKGFVGLVDAGVLSPSLPVSQAQINFYTYDLSQNTYPLRMSENTTAHVSTVKYGMYSNEIYFVQDFKRIVCGNVNYGVWMAIINYETGAIVSDRTHVVLLPGLNVFNIETNMFQLSILGSCIYGSEPNMKARRFIVQFDPSACHGVGRYIDDIKMDVSTSTDEYSLRQSHLRHMCLDYTNYSILSSGAYGGKAHLHETIDLNGDFQSEEIISHPMTVPVNVQVDSSRVVVPKQSFNCVSFTNDQYQNLILNVEEADGGLMRSVGLEYTNRVKTTVDSLIGK